MEISGENLRSSSSSRGGGGGGGGMEIQQTLANPVTVNLDVG
jgi:hypothetical protein